jgi:hypothetical protein
MLGVGSLMLRLGFMLTLTFLLPADASGADLDRLRTMYFAAVESAPAVDEALVEIGRMRSLGEGTTDPRLFATLDAYEGALITLRAKHGFWPNRRLQHLNDGLRILDRVVGSDPDLVEARYLRLMSCYYLPPILGRRHSVRDDFAVLARLLPTHGGAFAPDLFESMVRFVLDEGDPGEAAARALRRSIGVDDD